MATTPAIDRRALRRAAARHAARFDACATVVDEIARRLLEHIEPLRPAPGLMVDAGGGARLGNALAARFPDATVLRVDEVAGRLAAAAAAGRRWWLRRRPAILTVCAAPDRLPIADAAAAAIVSNLALAPLGEPDAILAGWARQLQPGGLCAFTTFGPDSLAELRDAHAGMGRTGTVHPFYDMHDVGDAMIRAGFSSPVLDVERLTVTYASYAQLVDELRVLGGSSGRCDRPRGLRTPRQQEAAAAAYARRAGAGRPLPLTLEVVYAHGWRRAPADRPQDGSTVAAVPIETLRRRR